jgi:AraC family L-rhamnose operon regulatory protein RhaS
VPSRSIITSGNHPDVVTTAPRAWISHTPQHPTPLLPELSSLGRASLATAYLDRTQSPPDLRLYEISCMLRGTDEWCVEDRIYRLGRGELFIAGPHRRLSSVTPRAPSGQLYWLTLRHDENLRLPALPPGASDTILEGLGRHAFRVIHAPAGLPALFERLIHEHQTQDGHAPWAARAVLHCLIAEVLRAYEAAPRAGTRSLPSARIAAVVALIEERLAEPLTVAELAAAAHLGIGQFHERFVAEVGFTPADYWSRRRILRAKELLAEPTLSVTDVALTLGFSTSQYFATFFRRFTGASPRDYRRRLSAQR